MDIFDERPDPEPEPEKKTRRKTFKETLQKVGQSENSDSDPDSEVENENEAQKSIRKKVSEIQESLVDESDFNFYSSTDKKESEKSKDLQVVNRRAKHRTNYCRQFHAKHVLQAILRKTSYRLFK